MIPGIRRVEISIGNQPTLKPPPPPDVAYTAAQFAQFYPLRQRRSGGGQPTGARPKVADSSSVQENERIAQQRANDTTGRREARIENEGVTVPESRR
jgi:hypothetical protein